MGTTRRLAVGMAAASAVGTRAASAVGMAAVATAAGIAERNYYSLIQGPAAGITWVSLAVLAG
jgi:hypothetical protein